MLAAVAAAGAMMAGAAGSPAAAQSAVHAPGAKMTHPADFSGIWKVEGQNGLRQLRPAYKPDWAKRYAEVRARLAVGNTEGDPTARCLPPGMPRALIFPYPVELLMTPGQVTVLTEYANEVRRIFTDGRKHPPEDEIEPTFRGHSIGHWEGKTLVADTIGLRPDTLINGTMAPHSDKLRVAERITMVGPNELKWEVTLDDPVAFTMPASFTIKLVRAAPEDEIREYVCLDSVPEAERKFDKAP
ncbi:MAG TPA: hypothetical protein VL358_08710 [Caulobacteraceae bacterium]|nr:hypothetical protein [Caulobacteraceae bacterium]